jgi:hypothetical protein
VHTAEKWAPAHKQLIQEENVMRLLIVSLFVIVVLTAPFAGAQDSTPVPELGLSAQGTQKWVTGWDLFGEPLNFTSSNVVWSLSPARKLTVSFKLAGATPNKLYQVGIHLFCSAAPGVFGQFPTNPASGSCLTLTRQGVTAAVASVEMGVVTTDRNGNGLFKVIVGPIASGTYNFEFSVRNGAGCNLIGGSGNSNCALDFQSPGPFGTTTTIVVP